MFERVSQMLVLALAIAMAGPGSASANTPGAFDWLRELAAVKAFLERPGSLNPRNCAAQVGRFSNTIERLPSAAFTPQSQEEEARVIAAGPKALEDFFRVRLLLKARLDAFANPARACVEAIRRGLRIGRFAEDYLADWLRQKGAAPAQQAQLFGGGPAQNLVNPRFPGVELRTGDVLMMRGPSFVSALIARAGDEAVDFSHLAIIGENDKGDKFVVEGLIESGVIIVPLGEYLENKKEGRVALLRHRDPAVAKRAGRMIHDRARASLDAGRPIPYNFKLDRSDTARLFCAQVVELAYSLATGGRVELPRFPSSLTKLKRTPVYDALGIEAMRTFSPSDIELDPRFQVVAEYRNANHLRDIRYASVVMTKMYQWLSSGYQIRADHFGDFVAGLALRFISRATPPEDLPKQSGVSLLVSLWRVGTALIDEVSEIDRQARSQTRHALTFNELMDTVERMRERECLGHGGPAIIKRHLAAPSGLCAQGASLSVYRSE